MTSRRTFLAALAGGILAVPLAAEAQPAGKAQRIGYLSGSSPTAVENFREPFRQGLHELGWIEGQNIVIDYRYAERDLGRLPDLTAELVRLPVDVIVALGTQVTAAAKKVTPTVPIVGISLGDPVETGLVASLARPGGNVTGVSYSVGVDTFVKDLELLRQIVPKVRRVAILWNPGNPVHPPAVRNIKAAAGSLGVQLRFLEARRPSEFDAAFATMVKERAGALLVMSDAMFFWNRPRLVEFVARSRLPAAYGQREWAEAGGLMSYGPSLPDLSRRAATYVDKILKGAKPGDLPIEQPTKFELVINLKTAKALGLTIPPSVLGRADQVIE